MYFKEGVYPLLVMDHDCADPPTVLEFGETGSVPHKLAVRSIKAHCSRSPKAWLGYAKHPPTTPVTFNGNNGSFLTAAATHTCMVQQADLGRSSRPLRTPKTLRRNLPNRAKADRRPYGMSRLSGVPFASDRRWLSLALGFVGTVAGTGAQVSQRIGRPPPR
jgi:hypothetical protein